MRSGKLTSLALAAVAVTAVWSGGGIAPVKKDPAPCHLQKVYVDQVRGLMWQDEAYTPKEDGAYMRERNYGKAGSYAYAVHYCENLNYAGFDDWRLPTVDELSDMHHEPGQAFDYFRDGDFWTVSPAEAGRYYVVYAADAYRYKRNPRKSYYIRCVRCIEPR